MNIYTYMRGREREKQATCWHCECDEYERGLGADVITTMQAADWSILSRLLMPYQHLMSMFFFSVRRTSAWLNWMHALNYRLLNPMYCKWEISLCCGKEDGNLFSQPRSPAAFLYMFALQFSLFSQYLTSSCIVNPGGETLFSFVRHARQVFVYLNCPVVSFVLFESAAA